MSLRDWPIRQKLTAMLVLSSGLVLLLTSAALVGYQYWSFRQTMRSTLSVRGSILATNSTASLAFANDADARELLSALRADPHIVAAALYDRNGRLFATYPGDLPGGALPAAPGPDGYRFQRGNLIGFQPVAEAGGQRLGTLYLASDLAAVDATLRLSGVIAVAVLTVALLAAYLLSRVLQGAISQPVLMLAETARAVSDRRDYSVRAAKLGEDELGVLTDAFNHMPRRHTADGYADRRPAETRSGHPRGNAHRVRGLERHGAGDRGRTATRDSRPPGGIRHRSGARGARRRPPAARGARESARQQLEVHRQTDEAKDRIWIDRRERRPGVPGPRQRGRLRHAVRRQAVRRVSAIAFGIGIRGHRRRPRDGAAHHHPARRPDLGRGRRRSGSDVLLHAVRSAARAWRHCEPRKDPARGRQPRRRRPDDAGAQEPQHHERRDRGGRRRPGRRVSARREGPPRGGRTAGGGPPGSEAAEARRPGGARAHPGRRADPTAAGRDPDVFRRGTRHRQGLPPGRQQLRTQAGGLHGIHRGREAAWALLVAHEPGTARVPDAVRI